MAYDEHLAERVREQLAAEPAVTEKAMFAGLIRTRDRSRG